MSNSIRKIWMNYKSATFSLTMFLSIVILIVGSIGALILGYLGTYKSNLKLITLTGLLLFSLIYILTILSLIHKSKMTWRLLVSLPLIAVLGFMAYVFIDFTHEIIEFGWLKCELCP